MQITYTTMLLAWTAGYCLWTGIDRKKPMKWYDRAIRITGGFLLSGLVILLVFSR